VAAAAAAAAAAALTGTNNSDDASTMTTLGTRGQSTLLTLAIRSTHCPKEKENQTKIKIGCGGCTLRKTLWHVRMLNDWQT